VAGAGLDKEQVFSEQGLLTVYSPFSLIQPRVEKIE
jgi:hypothetical protein